MESKWYHLKESALQLRKRGISIGIIEHKLGISRSTLSGWFKNIELSHVQKEQLLQNWRDGLVHARKKAVIWHNAQKKQRLEEAKKQAIKTLAGIDEKDKNILELALAILYMGEGSKKKIETALGSSDPLILKFFLSVLKNVYSVDMKKIRCSLYLRADQDPIKIKRFWAGQLKLPISSFNYANRDQRTAGSKTYKYYKGVCQISGPTVAIQRKLLYISSLFCERVTENVRLRG